MLDDFKAFVAAAEHSSFTGAAKSLGMTISTMSRRVQELESHLGVELFHRTSQGLSLTSVGEMYFQECAVFINELNIRIDNLQKSLNSVEGSLTVAMPTNIGSGPLNDFWERFFHRYPQITLRIHLADPREEMPPIPVDIGVQSGSRPNSLLIQERIGSVPSVLVASRDFASVGLEDIESLRECPSVAADLFNEWRLANGDYQETVAKQHVHTSNDMTVVMSLVKAGAGIALLPLSIVHHELESGSLKHVLPQWSGQSRELFWIWPYQRTLSTRAKCFKSELEEFLAEQAWFCGSSK